MNLWNRYCDWMTWRRAALIGAPFALAIILELIILLDLW